MTFAWEIFNILFVDLDYNAYIYRSFLNMSLFLHISNTYIHHNLQF